MSKPEIVDDDAPKSLESAVKLQISPDFQAAYFPDDKPLPRDKSRSSPKVNETQKHKPTAEKRWKVRLMIVAGAKVESIAASLGINVATLRKYYRKDLDQGVDELNSLVVGKLVEKIQSGDTSSIIFYLKTRARWSTTHSVEVHHSHVMKPRSREEIEHELKLLGVPDDKLEELAEE